MRKMVTIDGYGTVDFGMIDLNKVDDKTIEKCCQRGIHNLVIDNIKESIQSITINKNKKVVTVVFIDGDVQMSKCSENDIFDEKIGVALCIAQHIFGSKTQFKKEIEKKAKIIGKKENE